MATPARKFESEDPVEERLARLEEKADHTRADISDLKIELRRTNDKVDTLDGKLSAMALHMEKSFAELKVARALDRVWWLLMSGALLGLMARAFHWI